MSAAAPSVWVVVLDYNTGPVLFGCVSSFLRVRYPNLRVLLVDNASTDGVAVQVAARHPAVDLLRLDRNTGYCGGNNAGIRHALDRGAEYVLVVNPDTEVIDPDFVQVLVEAMNRHADAGVVGPLVHFRTRGNLQRTNCRLPFLRRKLHARLRRSPVPAVRPAADVEAEVLNGVCVLLRREMLQQVGAYDPEIFMYGEDWDLTLRMQGRGWKSYQVPVDGIVHLQKQEGYDYLSMTNFLLKRNAAYVLLKHRHPLEAVAVAIGGYGLTLLRALRSLLDGRQQAARHWQFVRRLGRAYVTTFSHRTAHPDFGPPVTPWRRC